MLMTRGLVSTAVVGLAGRPAGAPPSIIRRGAGRTGGRRHGRGGEASGKGRQVKLLGSCISFVNGMVVSSAVGCASAAGLHLPAGFRRWRESGPAGAPPFLEIEGRVGGWHWPLSTLLSPPSRRGRG